MADEFIDSSVGHSEVHTPTKHATSGDKPIIDNVIYKYGDGSGKFVSTNGEYVTFPDSVDFEFGAGDFTISGWFYKTSGGSGGNPKHWIHHQTTTSDRMSIGVPYGDQIICIGVRAGSVVVNIAWAGVNALDAGWHHFEIGRDQDVSGYIFIDGVKQTLSTNTYNGTMATPTGLFNVGYLSYASDFSSGNIDELKIDKGICRHTANFTPPTGEDVDNDSYTVLYLKMNASYIVIENLVLTDYTTLSDSVNKNTGLNLLQSLSLYDSLSKYSIKNLLSNLSLSDIRNYLLNKLLFDDLGFYDEFKRTTIGQLILSSIISLYDNVFKNTHKNLFDYIPFADYNRVYVTKGIWDNFNFHDVFTALIETIHYDYLYIAESIDLKDKVRKVVGKTLFDLINLNDSTVLYLQQEHISKLYIFNRIDLIDSVAKRIILVKNDNIGLVASLERDGYLSLQDTISLTDKIAIRVIKVLGEVIPLTDEITQLLEGIPFYFDNGRVEPEFTIADVKLEDGLWLL